MVYSQKSGHKLVITLCLLVTLLNCIITLLVILPSLSSLYTMYASAQSRINVIENEQSAQQDQLADLAHTDLIHEQDLLILKNITHSKDYLNEYYTK